MLKKRFRFHRLGSLKFVLGEGSSVRAGAMQLKFIKNDRRDESRLAVVVAKKVSKKAPQRNRIRRRVYEAARLQWPLLNSPYDLVVSVYDSSIADCDSTQLNRLVVELFNKAGLYK